jgi:hypothetical protein
MTNAIKVTSIHVDRMPGISSPGIRCGQLSPGVNILFGPNGTGKTSMGRAMTLALFGASDEVWKQLAQGSANEISNERREVRIEANFAVESLKGPPKSWRVEIDSTAVKSLVDGHPHLLSAGSPSLAQRYRMGLAELLEERNEEFAREMLRQAAGGIDLPGALKQHKLDVEVTRPRLSKGSPLQMAIERRTRAIKAQEELEGDSQKLAGMRLEEERLRGQQKLKDAIKHALKWHEQVEHIRNLSQQLDQIPAEARDLIPNARHAVGDLAEKVKEAERVLKEVELELQAHDRKQPDPHPEELQCNDVELASARGAAEDLAGAEVALREANLSFDASKRARDDADLNLFSRNAQAQAANLQSVEAIALDADKVASRVREARSRRDQHKWLERMFESSAWDRSIKSEDLAPKDAIDRSIQALTDWCKATDHAWASDPARVAAESTSPYWIWFALLALAFSTIALLLMGHYAAAISLPAIGIASWLAARNPVAERPAAPAVEESRLARSRFEEIARGTHVALPTEWTPTAVSRKISELAAQIVDHERIDAAAPVRSSIRDLGNDAALAENSALEACATFESVHGIRIAEDNRLPDEAWMPLMVRSVSQWRSATLQFNTAMAVRDSAQRKCDALREHMQEELKKVGLEKAVEGKELTASFAHHCLNELECRRKSRATHESQRLDLKAKEMRLEAFHKEKAREFTELWDMIGVKQDDYRHLDALIEANVNYFELSAQRKIADGTRIELEKGLAAHPQLMTSDVARLQQEEDKLGDVDELFGEIKEEIGAISYRISQASKEHDVSDRQNDVRAANEDLNRREREWAAAQIRRQVATWARENTQKGVVTPVVDRAKRLLTEFTMGGLDFKLQSEGAESRPALLARAGEAEEWRTVERLSSGERIQLLMAVRLAFLEESEERMLPIFLDEVLGSSDDVRAQYIIDAVISIARTGRQVFYATAQADEVEKWKARLANSGVPFQIVDLAGARDRMRSAAFPLPPLAPPPPRPPAPDGLSHEQYGAVLQVPGVDWSEAGIGSVHPWHVIEDPKLLHEALLLGLLTLDQVERVAALATDGPLVLIREAIRGPACAYRTASAGWRVGRGKEVTRCVLEESKHVSPVFLDRVTEIAQRFAGNARELISELGKNPPERWRKASTSELEDWLSREGFIPIEDPLAVDEIVTRVREELSRQGLLVAVSNSTVARIRDLLSPKTLIDSGD